MGLIIEHSGTFGGTSLRLIAPELVFYERTPAVGVIKIINKAKVSRKFTALVHSLDFGSVTVAVRINGTLVPGFSNIVPGTTPFRTEPTGGNILPVDGSLEVSLSRVSQPRGLSLQFEYDWIL